MKRNISKNQFFTPTWLCELIVCNLYPSLSKSSVVVDPFAGDGRMLSAVPSEVTAYGVEIDRSLIAEARQNSGREVYCADAAEFTFPVRPTLILTNPPYVKKTFDLFLDRVYEAMDYGGEVGAILPVYFFQTADTVMKYSERFSLNQRLIPRNVFQSLEKPLMFATFTKDKRTVMTGMLFYAEASDMLSLKSKYRGIFVGNESRHSCWGEAVETALLNLGGEGVLEDIYREIESSRPTKTKWWKNRIRNIVQTQFEKTGPATYRIPPQFMDAAKAHISPFQQQSFVGV